MSVSGASLSLPARVGGTDVCLALKQRHLGKNSCIACVYMHAHSRGAPPGDGGLLRASEIWGGGVNSDASTCRKRGSSGMIQRVARVGMDSICCCRQIQMDAQTYLASGDAALKPRRSQHPGLPQALSTWLQQLPPDLLGRPHSLRQGRWFRRGS